MKKLNVLLVFCLLSAVPLMAQEPVAPVADLAGQAVAAQVENGTCAVANQDSASLAIFAPDSIQKSCGILYSPCAYPAGAGPCKWSCPCPTYTSCTLLADNGCSMCPSP